MSQYIQDSRQCKLQAPSLIYGIFSKIICSSSSGFQNSLNKKMQKSSNTFYQLKKTDRCIKQKRIGQDLQHIIINQKYQKMKKKLKNYGRSQSLSLHNLFNKLEENKKSEFINSLVSNNRIVYVDRKYNNQFAIKMSTIYQAQQISKLKQNIKHSVNQKHSQPLVQQFKQQININKQKWNRIYKSLSTKKRTQSLNHFPLQRQLFNLQNINKLINKPQKQTQKIVNPVLLQIQKKLKPQTKTLVKKRKKVKTSWQRQSMPFKSFL